MKILNVLEQDAMGFLLEKYTAVLATCMDGEPHATTIYYDIDSDFNFYYLTKRNTQKNIQTAFNPNVALVVGIGPERITVQARGTAELLMEEAKSEASAKLIARLSKKGVDHLPIQMMNTLKGEHYVAYKITPHELLFMNMDSKARPKSVSKNYHKII
jgi:uncharacterized protein YhbP (UPF0306 family)